MNWGSECAIVKVIIFNVYAADRKTDRKIVLTEKHNKMFHYFLFSSYYNTKWKQREE